MQTLNPDFVLPTELCIYDAADLVVQMMPLLQDAQGLVADASGVQQLDLAGIQVLLLIRNEAAAAGKTFLLRSPSENFLKLFKLLGLTEQFQFVD